MENLIYRCGECNEALGNIEVLHTKIPLHACLLGGRIVEYTDDGRIYKIQDENNNQENILDSPDKRGDKWSEEATLCLISAYKDLEKKFDSPQFNNTQVWKQISDTLKLNNVDKSGTKCAEKWRNLKKTYIKIKKHNSSTGNDKKSWVFWNDLNEILQKNPAVTPILTISSTGLITKRASEQSTSRSLEESNVASTSKRKETSPLKTRNESLRIQKTNTEDAKERRHQERMEQKERMFAEFMARMFKDKP